MKKRKKKICLFFTTLIMMVSMAVPVFAETPTSGATGGDPITIISNLDNVIFGVVRGIGIGFAGFGLFQIGTSIPSHDAGQRAIGIASLVGAILMIFAKQLLTSIGAI